MKQRWIVWLLICLLLLVGCQAEAPGEGDTLELDGKQGAGGRSADTADISTQNNTGGAAGDAVELPSVTETGGAGRLMVEDAVAYAFAGTLYGGFTYTNAGGAPMRLTEAALTFTYSGGTRTEAYAPFMGVDDILQPGETACATLFLPVEGLAAGGGASLSVELQGEAAQERSALLEVSDARLIQNYPGFATLSGSLKNLSQEASSLCMVYVQFYDAEDTLLGVWYFTRNAVLQPGQDTAFVVHLQSLPIEGLAENTASMRFRAFGL